MFSLFKKKDSIPITDYIFMTSAAKWAALAQLQKEDNSVYFIGWFNDSLDIGRSIFRQQNLDDSRLLSAKECNSTNMQDHIVIFVEHYPLRNVETALFERLHLKKVKIYAALDEPLFLRFGGEKIVQLMQKMGMKETEMVQNNLISQAIRNAQEKMEKNLVIEQNADSQQDWIRKNLDQQAFSGK
jgi:hypothetical protein